MKTKICKHILAIFCVHGRKFTFYIWLLPIQMTDYCTPDDACRLNWK